MLSEDIKKKFEVITEAERKELQSAEIAEKTKTYEENGGIIQVIPIGVSSEFPDGSLPIKTQKDYREVKNRTARKAVGRKESRADSSKAILGAPCPIDGSRLRYKNGKCKMCESDRYFRQAKAKRENKVDSH